MHTPTPVRRGTKHRERVVAAVFLLALVAFVARLTQLQIFEHARWRAVAENQVYGTETETQPRGEISDRNGIALAVTLPLSYAVGFRPAPNIDCDSVAAVLADYLPYSRQTLRKRMREEDYSYLARRVDWQIKLQIEALGLRGIDFVREARRSYPAATAAATIIGFTNGDGVGQEGVERALDSLLRADPVRTKVWHDARRVVPALLEAETNRVASEAAHAQLTIDLPLQTILDASLSEALRDKQFEKACALLLDPFTGEILALSTVPTFDPNHPGAAEGSARRCWPVTDVYDPGSVFKIVTLGAALEEGAVLRTDLINCEGGKYAVPGKVIKDTHPHGVLSVDDVFAKSSNIGCAKIFERMQPAAIYEWIRRFGFGSRTDVGLAAEPAGLVPRPQNWSGPTRANLAMGHGVSATVLQMAMAFAAVANGGTLMQPRLIKSVHFADDSYEYAPMPMRRVLTRETAAQLTEMLERAVRTGTGKAAAIEGVRIAGKTGTAQKVDLLNKTYFKDRYVSSFAGFFPAEDPRYVLMIVVDDPRGAIYYGGQIAAPVFQTVARQILEMRHPEKLPIPAPPPTPAAVSGTLNEPGDTMMVEFVYDTVAFADAPKVPMPMLTGMPLRTAASRLDELGLGAQLVGNGRVTQQYPPAGLLVPVGYACELTASSVVLAR